MFMDVRYHISWRRHKQLLILPLSVFLTVLCMWQAPMTEKTKGKVSSLVHEAGIIAFVAGSSGGVFLMNGMWKQKTQVLVLNDEQENNNFVILIYDGNLVRKLEAILETMKLLEGLISCWVNIVMKSLLSCLTLDARYFINDPISIASKYSRVRRSC